MADLPNDLWKRGARAGCNLSGFGITYGAGDARYVASSRGKRRDHLLRAKDQTKVVLKSYPNGCRKV